MAHRLCQQQSAVRTRKPGALSARGRSRLGARTSWPPRYFRLHNASTTAFPTRRCLCDVPPRDRHRRPRGAHIEETLPVPETENTAGELFRAGKLTAAIEAANGAVRRNPADLGSRVLLAELLVFANNLERADTILDAASQIDSTVMIGVAEFRQLIRAALARGEHNRAGRVACGRHQRSGAACSGGRSGAPAGGGTCWGHAFRRFPRRRRSARRFLRGAHHYRKILLDPD